MEKYELYQNIGMRLKEARIAKQMTQERVAELIGITTGHYGRAERGEAGLGYENLYRVKQAMGIDLNYLFTGHSDTDDVSFLEYQALMRCAKADKRKNVQIILKALQNIMD